MDEVEIPGYREFMFRVVPQIFVSMSWVNEDREDRAIETAAALWHRISEHVLGEIAKVRSGDG